MAALTSDDTPTQEALVEIQRPAPHEAAARKVGVAAVSSVEWAAPFSGRRNLRAELTARQPQKYRHAAFARVRQDLAHRSAIVVASDRSYHIAGFPA